MMMMMMRMVRCPYTPCLVLEREDKTSKEYRREVRTRNQKDDTIIRTDRKDPSERKSPFTDGWEKSEDRDEMPD